MLRKHMEFFQGFLKLSSHTVISNGKAVGRLALICMYCQCVWCKPHSAKHVNLILYKNYIIYTYNYKTDGHIFSSSKVIEFKPDRYFLSCKHALTNRALC